LKKDYSKRSMASKKGHLKISSFDDTVVASRGSKNSAVMDTLLKGSV